MAKHKARKPRINLHDLATELSRRDSAGGYNANIVDTEVALHGLGEKLRESTAAEAFAIVNALIQPKP